MVGLPQIVLTGSHQTVTLPGNIPAGSSYRISNESNYPLLLTFGGYSTWLDPWTIDIFPASGSTILAIDPLFAPTASGSQSLLLISVASPGETFPGAYPIGINRTNLVDIFVDKIAMTVSTPAFSKNYSLPRNTSVINFSAPTSFVVNLFSMSIKVTGNATNNIYLNSSLNFGFNVNNITSTTIDPLDLVPGGINVSFTGNSLGSGGIATINCLTINPSGQPIFPIPTALSGPSLFLNQEVAATGSSSILAGLPFQTIRLYGWELACDQQSAGQTVAFLEDDTGGIGHRYGTIGTQGAVNASNSGNHSGAPMPLGSGLHLNVALLGTGGNVRAYVSASQG